MTTVAPSPPASIWEGVFATFAEARETQRVFESRGWLDRLADGHRSRAQAHAGPDREPILTADYILYPVAAATAARVSPLKVLDFGGGLASALYPLLGHLGARALFELHVVETGPVCELGRSLVDDRRVRFLETLPNAGRFDIVHAGSSLHYVEDWRAAIAQMQRYAPDHLILADVPAGSIPRTVATRQHYYGATIASWLFRLDELRAACETNGYRTTFDARFRRPYFGQDLAPPMAAMPTEFRLDSFRQLMFSRITT